jgi:hypothetical protein
MLAKYMFQLSFDFPAIKLPKYPKDTNVYVTWRDIDTIYFSVREVFKKIENDYGFFKFWKAAPEFDTGYASQLFWITFDNWVVIPYIEYAINGSIKNAKCEFQGGPTYGSTKVHDDLSDFSISPNPATDHILIQGDLQYQTIFEIISIYGNKYDIQPDYSTQGTVRLNISNLPTGIYLLRIHAPNQSHSIKFIKE